MTQNWQVPAQIRLVPSTPIPEKLFVCMARIKPDAGAALRSAYDDGKDLPKDFTALYNEFLTYEYSLGENGSYWEAGPSSDFTEILYIFSTASLEEARQLMAKDPFYREGVFYDDLWFGWSIHVPPWKLASPEREGMEWLMKDVGILRQ
jgi:hypothetical protein